MLSRSFPLTRYAFQPPVGVSTRLVHTPVLWAYWPLMMVARLGQHSAFETKALPKLVPISPKTARVLGMYLRSSFRMSSVRMKTMLGFAVSARASRGALERGPTESSTAKAITTSTETVFLIRIPPVLQDRGRMVKRPRPVLLSRSKYRGRRGTCLQAEDPNLGTIGEREIMPQVVRPPIGAPYSDCRLERPRKKRRPLLQS